MLFQREAKDMILRYAQSFPAVGVIGPRQSGKTTLSKALFNHLPYTSLENLDERTMALQDPRAYIARYQEGAIFDEIQHAPNLLSYLQEHLDNTGKLGQFVLTGSQNFILSNTISQSLSGRIGMSTLLPLSLSEIGSQQSAEDAIILGGYPGLHQHSIRPVDFYQSYIQTYVERDVRQIKNITNVDQFQRFVKLCAGRVGQLLNLSTLAQDADISHTTAREWLSLLQASYLVFTLQPFHNNFNKRLVKMPKLYFYDTGLAAHLLGIESSEQLSNHYHRGALYENLVILECLKHRLNQGLPPNLYFWRDHGGHEVDLIAEWGSKLVAIEIKAAQTFRPEYLSGLNKFAKFANPDKQALIYTGEQTGQFKGVELTPIDQIKDFLSD